MSVGTARFLLDWTTAYINTPFRGKVAFAFSVIITVYVLYRTIKYSKTKQGRKKLERLQEIKHKRKLAKLKSGWVPLTVRFKNLFYRSRK